MASRLADLAQRPPMLRRSGARAPPDLGAVMMFASWSRCYNRPVAFRKVTAPDLANGRERRLERCRVRCLPGWAGRCYWMCAMRLPAWRSTRLYRKRHQERRRRRCSAGQHKAANAREWLWDRGPSNELSHTTGSVPTPSRLSMRWIGSRPISRGTGRCFGII